MKRLVFALVLSLWVVHEPSRTALAQSADSSTPSPWSYAPDIRAPTDGEYDQLRERFSQAMAHRAEENFGAAIPLLRENLEVERRTYGPEHPVTGMAMFALAGTLEAERRYREAETLMVDAIRIAETWLPERHAWFGVAYSVLGMCQGANGKRALAEESFRRAIEVARSAGDASTERAARTALADMTRFYEENAR